MEIEYTLEVHVDDTPVRGNAMASEDPVFDRSVEDNIIDSLNRGDVWAWAHVVVRATVTGCPIQGSAHLGTVSCENEQQFLDQPDYQDLCDEAKEDLLAQLATTVKYAESLGAVCLAEMV